MSKVKRQRLLKPRILQLRIAMTYEAMKEYICLSVSQSMLANIYLASLVIDKTYFYFLLSLCSAYHMLQKKLKSQNDKVIDSWCLDDPIDIWQSIYVSIQHNRVQMCSCGNEYLKNLSKSRKVKQHTSLLHSFQISIKTNTLPPKQKGINTVWQILHAFILNSQPQVFSKTNKLRIKMGSPQPGSWIFNFMFCNKVAVIEWLLGSL